MNEINKLTCKFQNPEVEEKYFSFSWKSKSRSIKIGLYFILVIIGGSIGAEFLERSSNSNLAGFILGLLGAFILLKSSDNFRRKYFERFFAFYLSIMVPINSYINIDIYRLDYDLPTFPFLITIIILKILPISHSNLVFEDAEFEKFYKAHFDSLVKPSIYFKCISSRNFDAIGTKTIQILLEGRYNDILKPNEHYLSLKKDYSNFKEILEYIKDNNKVKKITEQALSFVKQNHLYKNRVDHIIKQITS